MIIKHIRENKKLDYVVVDNKLILSEKGQPKRHKPKIIGTLVKIEDKIGYALCRPDDQFSRKLGVKIASQRAKSGNTKFPPSIRKHVKKFCDKYGLTLPEFHETENKSLLFSELVDDQVLEVVMKYEDDPTLFENWALGQSDIDELNGRVIFGENLAKSQYLVQELMCNSIYSHEAGYDYPLQLFGILDK